MPKRVQARKIGPKTSTEDIFFKPVKSKAPGAKTHASFTPPQVSLRSYKKTAFGFLGLAAALLLAIAYVSFSKAAVIVTARAGEEIVEMITEVRKEPADGEIFGEVKSLVLEGERIEEISGEKSEVPAMATGTIKIINEFGRSQQLVATTRFLSKDGVLFRLKKGVLVPAKSSLKAEVYADKLGKEGNIAESKFTIPGLNKDLQKTIYGLGEEPMTGGVVLKTGVSQSDIDRAAEEIAIELLAKGMDELKNLWIAELGNAELYQKKILQVSADPKVGSDAKSIKVRAKVQIDGIRFDREKLYSLLEIKLKERSGADRELRGADGEGLVVEISKLDLEAGTASLKGKLRGVFGITERSAILDPEQLVGLTKSSAENYLRGFHSVEDVKIKISPFWLQRLPNLKDRINIKVITE